MEKTPQKTNKVKPKLRGVSHQWAAIVSIFFGAWLVMETPNEEVRWIASIYALSLTLLLGVSAIYHRVHWTPERRAWMRRLDHTMIFVLIAGSYTPVCILGLEGAIADWMLKIVWEASLSERFTISSGSMHPSGLWPFCVRSSD